MEWLDHLMPVIQSYSSVGYWLIFLIAFFETLVFIGSFIPGTFIMIFYGFLAASGYFNLIDLLILSVAGAVLGDGVSFYLGLKSQKLFHDKNFLFHTKYLEKSQAFFAKHGDKSIFWGRFIGIIKPFIPFVAGLSGMAVRRFIFWNIFSGIIWAVAHLLVGYFFGGAFQTIEAWATRLGVFTLVSFIFFWILWFSIRKGEKALDYTLSFIHSTGWSLVNSFPVRWFYHKFPKLYSIIFNRFKKDSFWGLPFTFLTLALLLAVLSLLDITKDILISNPVVLLDLKIENLLVVFRDSFLVRLFLAITALGEFQIIVSLTLILTAVFWLWKKRFYILSLWVTVVGSSIFAYLAKVLINRDRPGGNIPVFTEPYFSFPSGHAAAVFALFGFLVYCVWRNSQTWVIRVNSFFIASTLILLVGFSRLYLGVHFLSDVLGGYLIGFLWLLLGIVMSEWLISRSRKKGGEELLREIKDEQHIREKHLVLKFFTGLLIAAEVFYVGSFVVGFKPIFNAVNQTTERQVVVRNVLDPLFEKYIPKFPENLMGDYQAPLNFIVLAGNDEIFQTSFLTAGWLPAEPINLVSLTKILVSYFQETQYDQAPVRPLFWHGRPDDFVFVKPVSDDKIGLRYKVRFWKTDIMTEDGSFVYVGSTELDQSVEYVFLRIISPNLDIARDQLFKDLSDSELDFDYNKRSFLNDPLGKYYESGKYLTDGQTYFIYLK